MSRFLFAAVLLAAVSALSASFFGGEDTDASVFFSETLHAANVRESVHVRGTLLEVRDGAVFENEQPAPEHLVASALKLAYSKTLARRDPLMALAGTDPQKLERAVRKLEISRGTLESVQPTWRESGLIRYGLHPTQTLRALADVEKKRQEFLESGSAADERHYHQALARATARYHIDLQRFRIAFKKTVPKEVRQYATLDKLISRDGTLEAIDTLDERMRKSWSLAQNRIKCTKGSIRHCDPQNLAVSIEAPEQDNAILEKTLLIAKETRARLEKVTGSSFADTPTIALSQSACAPEPLVLVHNKMSQPYNGQPWITFVGDPLYIRTEDHADTPFYAELKNRGFEYIEHAPSYYTCFEIGTDWGRAFAIENVRSFAEESKLSRISVHSEYTQRLKELARYEASLASSLVRESDAAHYLSIAQELGREGAFESEITNEIESLVLQLQNRSALFDASVQTVANVEKENSVFYTHNVPTEIGSPYLFFVRSGFLLLFLADNISVTGDSVTFFEENHIPLNERPYVPYSSLRNDRAQRDVLEKDVVRRSHLYTDIESGQ